MRRARAIPFPVALALMPVTTTVSVSGCAPGGDGLAAVDPGSSRAIVNGTPATTCSWPSAVLTDGCSGTLIHPRVVITAAHCVKEGISAIYLGETSSNLAKTIAVSRCTAHPDYNGNTDDIGVCTLLNQVVGLPIVPVMAPCEEALLEAGAPVTEVGYGQLVRTTGNNDGFGTKRWMAGTIRTVATSRGQIDVTTGTQDGEYFGDSGGPLFFQMPDGTWRVAGADSASPDIIPGSNAPRVSTYTSVAQHVAWLEETTGIDLTPCHDAAGWNPSTSCTGLTTTPGDGAGTWSTTCSGQKLVTPQATCGGASTAGSGGASGSGGRDGAGSTPDAAAPGTGGRDGSGGDGRAEMPDALGGGDAPGTGGVPAAGSGGAPGTGPSPGANASSGGCACTAAAGPRHGSDSASGVFVLAALGLLAARRPTRERRLHVPPTDAGAPSRSSRARRCGASAGRTVEIVHHEGP